MWKVKRMNRARIVVLTIAIGAGGVAACLASGSDSEASPPTEQVVQLRTVDVLAANSDIGLGLTAMPNHMMWQSWPAATASNASIRRSGRPDATRKITGSNVAEADEAEVASGDEARQRGNIKVVRYGVTGSAAVRN